MKKQVAKLKLTHLALATILLSGSNAALASGFQLFEQNGAGVGTFDAGGAAEAADASTAFYNPAGLVMLDKPQVVFSVVGIDLDLNLKGTSVNSFELTRRSLLPPFNLITSEVTTSVDQGSAQGGGFIPVPALHIAVPVNDRVVLGLSVVAPFGLETDYSKDSFVRYAATDTKITDIDITPTIGIKVTDKFSVGAGIDFNYVEGEFDSMTGLGDFSTIFDPNVPNTDTSSKNVVDDWAYSWHAGVLYQFDSATRVGLAYHSKINVKADGTSTLKGPMVGLANDGEATVQTFKSNDLSTDFELPAMTTLSLFHQFDERIALMATVNYTQWSVFNKLTLKNVAAVQQAMGRIGFDPAIIDVTADQNFHNTWRVALGTNVTITDHWMAKAGIGFDQDPTNDIDRNARLPDVDRYAISFGVHYQPTKNLGFDAGYQHLITLDGDVDNVAVAGQQSTHVVATAHTNANLYGLQMTWTIT